MFSLFIQEVVSDHQRKRALVTPEIIEQFMAIRPLSF